MSDSALHRLAEASGLILCYSDALGVDRRAPDRSVRLTLSALGRPAESETDAAEQLRILRHERATQLCAPVLSFAPGERRAAPVAAQGQLRWRIVAEDGREFRGEADAADLPEAEGGERRLLDLPADLPEGYHELSLECGEQTGRARVIVAPQCCHLPPSGARRWGIALQLYSLRSGRNFGVGDYTDLAVFSRMAAEEGAHFAGLNPLHALFPADPGHFGPYSPSSRAFLNTAYIDPVAAPGFADCAEAQALMADGERARALEAARAADLVDYQAVDALKRPVLEALWRDFREALGGDGEASARFAAFESAGGEALRRHALFDALHEHFLARDPQLWSWRRWPAEYQRPDSGSVGAFAIGREERVHFFTWLQWLASEQLGAASAAARGAGMEIGLYQDLAVGVDPAGAAAWADQDMVLSNVAVGAPPDQLNPKGQNWGLAPYDPNGLAQAGFDPFIADVRAAMRHAGAMRLDHVMGLQRLFWVPAGVEATEGLYMRYPRQDMLAVVALESQRQNCAVIGEDLGTVPEGFREAMAERDVLTYKVLYFEREGNDRLKRPDEYPEHALATATTHDLPTLRGAVKARDLDLMNRLGLFPDEDTNTALHADREWLIGALREALTAAGLTGEDADEEDLVPAAYAYLARSPSLLLCVAAEDLAGMEDQPNLPGTVDEHPNWRRKLPAGVETLFDSQAAMRLLDAVRRERPAE